MSFSTLRPFGRIIPWLLVAASIAIAIPAHAQGDASARSEDGAVLDDESASPPPEEAAANDLLRKPAEGAASSASKPAAESQTEAEQPAVPASASKTGKQVTSAGQDALQPALPGQHDIFSQRSEQVLKNEADRTATRVHPLANRYPDHDVTICTAGCGPGGKIVYMQRRKERRVVEQAEMQVSAGGREVPADNAVKCIAGCYATPKVYRGVEKRADLVRWDQPSPGTAVTRGSESGGWLTKINTDQAGSGPSQAGTLERVEKSVKPSAEAAKVQPAPEAAPQPDAATEVKVEAGTESKLEPTAVQGVADDVKAAIVAPKADTLAPGAEPSRAASDAASESDDKNSVTPASAKTEVPPTKSEVSPGEASSEERSSDVKPEPADETKSATRSETPKVEVAQNSAMPAAAAVSDKTDSAVTEAGVAAQERVDTPAAKAEAKDETVAGQVADAQAVTKPVIEVETKGEDKPTAVALADPAAEAVAPRATDTPAASASGAVDADRTVLVSSEDKEMNAAIAKARASLGSFWEHFDKPGEGERGFSLKVAISDNGHTEHFWLTEVERKDGKLAGKINNSPELVKKVRLGERYTFSEAEISDWLFMRNGKMVGNETMRPLLKHMPVEEAAAYRGMLETP